MALFILYFIGLHATWGSKTSNYLMSFLLLAFVRLLLMGINCIVEEPHLTPTTILQNGPKGLVFIIYKNKKEMAYRLQQL